MKASSHRWTRLALAVALLTACAWGSVALTAASGAARTRSAHSTATRRRLVLVSRDPAVVRGSGFAARRRIRVTLQAGRGYIRRALADAHGSFGVTFPTIVDRCTAWSLTAVQGAAAPLVVRGPKPQCAPASTP